MAASCPNKSTPEWKALESALGEVEAYRAWALNNGEYPTPNQAKFQQYLGHDRETGIKLLEKHADLNQFEPGGTVLDLLRTAKDEIYTESSFVNWLKKPVEEKKELVQVIERKQKDFITEINDLFPDTIPGLKYDEKFQDELYGEEVISKIAKKLSENLGIPFEIVTPEQAAQILSKTKTPYQGQAAFFFNGKAFFLQGRLTSGTVFHEFAHPLIKVIAKENPDLFTKLWNDLAASEEGQQIIDMVRELYPDLEPSSDRFIEEVLVHALEKAAVTEEVSKGFKSVVDRILFGIRQILRKLFGSKIRLENLSQKTTIKELVEMMKGDTFQIETEIVTEADFAEFKEDWTKFMKDIKTLQKENKAQQIIDEFFQITMKQIDMIKRNHGHFAKIKEVLTSDHDSGLLQSIKKTLYPFQNVIHGTEEELEALRDQVEREYQQGTALMSSLSTMSVAADRIHKKLIEIRNQEGDPSRDTINEVFHYNYLVKYWSNFLKETSNLMPDEISDEMNEFMGGITKKIEAIDRVSKQVYKKFAGSFVDEQVWAMKEAIDNRYEERKASLKAKGAPQSELNSLEEEYKKMKLDREKIDRILSGKEGDMNFANSFFESYMLANDPVIGGFATFMKNTLATIENKVQNKSNKMMDELIPLLKKAGYNPSQIASLGKELTFKDKIARKGPDGKYIKAEVFTFLNRWKDYRFAVAELKQEIEDAEQDGDPEKVSLAWEKFHEHQRDYFHRENVDEFYSVQDKYKKTELGRKAFKKRSDLLYQIGLLNKQSRQEIEIHNDQEEINMLWREYTQLYSLTDIDGNEKTGEERAMAQLLRDYREESKKFYEWKEKPGAFEDALNQFEEQLVASGIERDTDEFTAEVDKWKVNNTRTVYDESWYEQRTEIFERIKSITERLDEKLREKIDISETWSEILDNVSGFRDTEGQPVATDMTKKRLSRIKQLQQAIVDAQATMAGLTGLTVEEYEELQGYFSRRKAGVFLSVQEENRFDELIGKKEVEGLDEFEKADLMKAYGELAELQVKIPTDYYMDRINFWTSELKKESWTKNNTNEMLQKGDQIDEWMESNAEFKEWFLNNHIAKMRVDKETGQKYKIYERLYVWSVVQPRDDKYVKKINLTRIDPLTGQPEQVKGIPAMKFMYRVIKPEYRTPRVLGETIDVHGNWLPKTVAEGAKDDRYVNKEYHRLKETDPNMFELLEAITKHHLELQQGIPRESRLGYDIPRYSMSNLEYAQRAAEKGAERVIGDLGRAIAPGAIDIYHGLKNKYTKDRAEADRLSVDDYEHGLNYDKNNQLIFVRADMFNEEITNIPVTGLSRLETEDTSLDILFGMHRYMYSVERQKTLIEINPIARAIQETLEDKGNGVDDLTRASRWHKVNNNEVKFLKKSDSNRIRAFNALYAREFKGELVQKKVSPGVQKFVSFLMKRASFGFFAMNIPSALKNKYGGMFQNAIEASGGEHINAVSLAKGTAWSKKALLTLQHEIFTAQRGAKSLDTQITEIFDASQGRFSDKFGESTSRSALKDAASFSWFTSPRKFMELESTYQLFGGMMHNIFVKQTLPDGSTKRIPYIDAWELGSDKQIRLKAGIDPEYGIGGKHFNRVRNLIHEKGNQLYGTYAAFDQPDAQRYLLFRMASFMRRYFISMFMNRFAVNRYNWGTATVQEGFYWTSIKSLWKTMMSLGGHVKYMSKEEGRAMKKLVMELAMLLLLDLMKSAVFDYDDDDKDRFKKLREKSGDLLSDDFKLTGWISNHLLNLIMQIRNENEGFIPAPGYGLDDYLAMKNVTSVVFGPTLDSWGKIAQDIWWMLTGDESAYYKQDVGPYSWQKEGEAKVQNHFMKQFGVNGATVDPVNSMKNFEAMKNKQ